MSSITFLGTGTSQGIPMIGCSCPVCRSADSRDNRLRTSALVETAGLKILIDCGPDFRQQMLRSGITDLDAVLLTHLHKDHTGGMDDIRAFNYFRKKAFPVYAEPNVQQSLRREYAYAFETERYPGVPEYELITIGEEPFSVTVQRPGAPAASVEVVPIRAMHYKLPVLGFRIGPMAYITDANYIPPQEFGKLKNLDIFVLNAVRRERHISHFSLPETLEIFRQVGARRSFITHMSHQIGLHREVSAELPEGVEPAYDGLVCTF